MEQGSLFAPPGCERLALRQFTEKAYLDYSMYVILDRALPHIGDGLKPVQRRIVYAMSELGLSAQAKPKKSARTVGDVLGKYHPHGDLACYEAMVLMAQPFSSRYPLLDGQGNWGSADDPKSFAAMRYTEARLSRYAELLLAELDQGAVDWQSNFDGTLEEPKVLPARLPNVLLNGATGIAVGMATDIPPHNLREVAAALQLLLKDPDTPLEALCAVLPGPDLPVEAEIITPRAELQEIYRTGYGVFRMRARYEREQGDILITALPYQVSGARVLEQIAQQMHAKKLPLIEDLRDESDHEHPTRLVLTLRSSRVDVEQLMGHLFATTDLEKSYRVNLNVIGLDGRPQVKDLRTLLREWLQFRTATVRRRLQWRLQQVQARLHILGGLLIAFLNLDEVVRVHRHENAPKPVLMTRFALTEQQAEAVLELKLRQLARLEEMKIREEQAALEKERDQLQATLASPERLKALIAAEIEADARQYGDSRRSPLVERSAARALDETQQAPAEAVTVVLSRMGWVRAAKGHEVDAAALSYKTGDGFLQAARGRSHQPAVFLDSTGRSYALPAHTLPSARGNGEPLTGRLQPPPGAVFVGVVLGQPEEEVLLASTQGYGFLCRIEDLVTRNKSGKAVVQLTLGAVPLPPLRLRDRSQERLAVVDSSGHLLVFPVAELPSLPRGKGNRLIAQPDAESVAGSWQVLAVALLLPQETLIVHASAHDLRLKAAEWLTYTGARGSRGRRLPRGFQRVERLDVSGA